MKEHPIIFSGPMVRAILDGRKTQTRRVVTARNSTVLGHVANGLWNHLRWDRDDLIRVDPGPDPFGGAGYQYLHVPAHHPEDLIESDDDLLRYRVRPRIEPGDRLWVREKWGHDGDGRVIYAADYPDGEQNGLAKWLSPIHMPRPSSRITLEVVGVRAERVQNITMRDAEAEGYPFVGKYDPDFDTGLSGSWGDGSCAAQWFRRLWDSINAKRGHGWDTNPWVWVVEFEREQ